MVPALASDRRALPAWLVPVSLAAILAVAAAGGLLGWAAGVRAHAVERWRGQLSAMADDRRAAIGDWVHDRLGDVRSVAAYPTTVYLASGRRGGPYPFPSDEGGAGHLTKLLRSAQDSYGYEAAWLVGAGPEEPVLARTTPEPPPRSVVQRVRESGRPTVAMGGGEGRQRVIVAAPVRPEGRGDGPPIGVALLAIDARRFLFDRLGREPLATRTGESLLVRREGTDVVFISPLRHGRGRVRLPMGTSKLAAAAALAGQEGFGGFRDYRGVDVLAAVRPIPDTGWGLVVKIDRDEALESARAEIRRTSIAALGLLLALMGVGFGLWRQHAASARIALARSEARFGLVLEHAADAILFVRPDGRIVKANRRAEELYGIPRSELEGLRIHDLYAPDEVELIEARMKAVRRQPGHMFEAQHRARDGTSIPVEVSSRFLEMDGGGLFFSIIRDVRQRKAAAAALAESQAFLQTLVDSASAAIFTLHPDGRVGDVWNPAAERLFGWSREEVVGNPAPLVPPDRQDEFRALRQLILEGRHLTSLEVTRVRSDGMPVELSLAASPIRDSAGRVTSILAVAVDITERKRAEAALQESEARFKRLAENAPDLLYRHRLRPSPRTEYVSPAVQALAGHSPDDFYADPDLISKRIHPDDRHLLDEAARGENPSGKPVLVRWLRPDGATIWTEIRNVLVRDEQGTVVALEGIARDVTERIQAERTVRRLSAAVEQSPVAIVITDPEGTIEYVNPAFTRQTGYSREEALGKNPRILKSGHHPPELYAELFATIQSGREWRGEMLNRKKSGELYWESASISPIVDEQGRITHYLAVQEDITERKEAEESLRQAQEQLLQSQKLEAVGRLAGGVAHDFNNLLGVIIGHGELAQRAAPPDDPSWRRLDQILGAARRAADLTRQLLAFSRRQVLQPRILDLNAEVAETEKMLRRLIGEDVELVTRLDPELGRVRADPGQIGQVLMNLAVNARDAMPRGGVLRIETSNLDVDEAYARDHAPMEPGPYVQLVVADNGTGMDEAVREHLFEPFFTTKPEGQGSGLGLSTVYGIVKQSGGYVWVDSEPGRGTTFTLQLPRQQGMQEVESPTVAAAPVGGSETILLVEDQENLRSLIGEVLEDAGYEVLSAAGGPAALALSASHPGAIHLLLSDVVMPGMSGRELAEALRGSRPGTRTLFISGYSNEVIGRSGELENLVLLEKPFSRTSLLRRVRETLSATRD